MEKNKNNYRFRITLLLGFIFSIIFSISAASALDNTYYWTPSSGAIDSSGYTANWGSCGQSPTTYRITTLSSAGFICNSDYLTTTSSGDQFLAIYPTAYSSNTTITGKTGATFYLSGQGRTATYRFDLGYAKNGTFISLGYVTRSASTTGSLYIIDMSSITGTAPNRSYLALKVSVTSSRGGRIYLGTNGGVSGSNSGRFNVSETAASPPAPTYNVSISASPVSTDITAGSNYTYNIIVNNIGSANGNYTLSVTDSDGSNFTGSALGATAMQINSGSSAQTTLTITAAASATTGAIDDTTVTVKSVENSNYTDSTQVQTTVVDSTYVATVNKTYYVTPSLGAIGSSGFTANWGDCGAQPISYRITTLNSIQPSCNSDSLTTNSSGDQFLAIFPTASSSDTQIVGKPGATFYLASRQKGYTAIYRFDLGYAISGSFISLGNITQTVSSQNGQEYTLDMSSISGTAPNGSYPALKVSVTTSKGGKVYIGTNGGQPNSNSGRFYISETPIYNVSGYVFDNYGSGLGNVLIQNRSTRNITSTSGYYKIDRLPKGTYNFSYSKAGFNIGYLEVTINGMDIIDENKTIYDTMPPASVSSINITTGNFYIKNTWVNPSDAYLNYTWFRYSNGTALLNISKPTDYLNLTWQPHYIQNISAQTVDIYGNINQTRVWFNATIPDNAPVLLPTGDKVINEGQLLTFNVSATDADNDTIIYGTNATKGTFNITTGEFSWIPEYGDAGIYTWYFNSSDSYGSVSNKIITVVTVNNVPLSTTSSSPLSDPTTMQGVAQNFNISLNRIANVTWYINGHVVKSNSSVISANYTNSTADIGWHNVTTVASDSYDSISRIWNWTVIAQPTYNISGYVFDNYGSGLGGVLVKNNSKQNTTEASGYYLITGLLNGTYNFNYSKTGFNTGYLEVIINGADNTSANITIYDTTPPVQVTGLINDTPTQTTVNLTWNSAADANYYQIFRNSTSVGYAKNTYWNDTGLTADTLYEYAVRANDSYNNWGQNSSILDIKTAQAIDTIPPASVSNPTTLAEVGSFYINNTWINPADADYNHTWFRYSNGTTVLNVSKPINYLNLTWSPHYTQNISAQTVDTSGNVNQTKVWFNATIPDNAPVQLQIGDKVINEGQLLTFNVSATDADNDTITYGTNATKGSFNITTGNFSWLTTYSDAGTYIWYFNSSDGYGGIASKTITIIVNNVPLSVTNSLPADDPTTTVGTVQAFSISLNRTANTTWYINGSIVQSNSSASSANYTNSTASVVTYNVTVAATDGYDAISKQWNWTVNPQPVYAPSITSWSDSKTNNNSLTLTVNTSETVNFNATANQTITTWNWYQDGMNQNNNHDNFTTSWSTLGTKSIQVNATNSNGTSNTITWAVTVIAPPATYIPPFPANITSITGNFWVNTTWQAGAGNTTDSYNVSVNGAWTNGTTNKSVNSSLSAHAWQNVTVYAYNASGGGSLSASPATKNTQIPDNQPVQSPIGNKAVYEGQWLNFTVHATDADNDTITYGTNATKGNLNTTTGNFSWLTTYSDAGVYVWYFNSSDGYGGVASETITVTVNNTPLSVTSFSPPSDPTTIQGTAQIFNIALNRTANVTWYMNGSIMQTDSSAASASYTNSTAGTGIWNVTAIATDGIDTALRAWNWTVNAQPPTAYIPPNPTNLQNATGNFWVNNTWQAGSGNTTDSYNASINGTWHNGTTDTYYNNSVGPHGWSNMTVWAYNSSGSRSSGSVSQNTQVPNNLPIQSPIGNKTVNEGQWLNFTVDTIDLDNDTITHGTNGTKGTFNTTTGQFSWTPSYGNAGVYTWYFNSSDGYGGVASETITVTVINVPLFITNSSPASDPATVVGTTQIFGISLNRTANVTWYINGSIVGTNSSVISANHTNSTAGAGTYNVTATASDGYDSISRIWTWIVSPQPVYAPDITTWSNSKTNSNSLTLTVNTNEAVNFNATANQTIAAWNWYKDGANQNNNYDNLTTSWNTPGIKTVQVNATDSNGTSNTVTWTVTVVTAAYIPPPPVIGSTAGNFWVNTTWQAGVGNATDSYNVSVNGSWTNGTTSTYVNSTLSAHAWQNVTVFAYNASGGGSLSISPATKNTQIPDNPLAQSPIGAKSVDEGQWLNFTVHATDADNDTITYGTNATKGSFNATTGNFSWLTKYSDSGTYIWYFNSSDGYSGVASETITVTVNNTPLSITSFSPPSDPTTMQGTAQTFNVILNRNANVTWYMNSTQVQTNTGTASASYTNSTAGAGIWNVTASATDGIDTVSRTWNWTVNAQPPSTYIPPDPTNLQNTTGNFWINHMWQAGSGNTTDSYNVSVNGTWHNGITSTYYNNTVGPHGWSNITVWAYNSSGAGSLSSGSISQNTQVPDNLPIKSSIGNKTVNEGRWLNFTVHATDADNDTITYGTNATKGSLNTTTGNFSWLTTYSDAGVYVWYFNSSDGYGGVVSETITVTVNNIPLSVDSFSPLSDSTTTQGMAQTFNVTLNKTANVTWYMNGLQVQTNTGVISADYTNSTAAAGAWNVTANATDGIDTVSRTWNWTINALLPATYIPADPTNLQNTTGNFWVNHMWQPGAGNITGSYNVSVNGTWYNGTTNAFKNSTTVPHGWVNITVWAYNSSGTGSLSPGSISQNTHVADNPPLQGPIGNKSVDEGQLLTFKVNATDADNDTITYGTNATKGAFNTITGDFSWVPTYGDAGIYTWYFNSSDGYGGVASETVTVTVNNVSLSITSSVPANDPTTTEGTLQTFEITLNRAANISWYINGYKAKTNSIVTSENYTNSTAGAGVYNVTAVADNGYDLVSKQWNWTVNSQPVYASPGIISWSNSKTNNNNITLAVNTGETVNFTATANQTITTWNWYLDGVNQNNNKDNFTVSWNTAGTKTIQVNATNNNGTSNTITWTITVLAQSEIHIPPSPNITSITGNFWVNTTWQAGAGNVTDSYNISVNGAWTNGTTNTSVNSSLSAHVWQNVTVYAYNASGGGSLSTSPAMKNTQIPDNQPIQSLIGAKFVYVGQWLNFTVNTTDADNDVITYGTNATKGTFNATTGNFSWLTTYSDAGTYSWYFNSSDGYGGVANETIRVSVAVGSNCLDCHRSAE